MYDRTKKKRKRCICNRKRLLGKITGTPEPLSITEINKIRLNLFTERNSDGTGSLVLRGKDIYDRYRRRIVDSDIKAIYLYLRDLPRQVTTLDLAYNNITDTGFFKLLKRLLVKGRTSIINLNIMNNKLTQKSVENLAQYARLIKLQRLRINGNDFGINCGEYIAKFIMVNKTLEFLDIGEITQTLTSVAHIITSLRIDHGDNNNVKVFDLSRVVPLFNRYSYETKWLAYHIEYLLERNKTIIELHLEKNQFISHDIDYFARGLRRNDTLLYLNLGYNRIGDYGAELLAKYLAEGPQLLVLNLAGNDIHNTGARALSFGMPFSKIRALDVSQNKLTDRGILDLLNSIKKPFQLRFLNIWGNKFNHITCGVIDRMLESGVLKQDTIDIKIYKVDEVLYAAYYPNPADRTKHFYYCELDFGYAQPICHIKRNGPPKKRILQVERKRYEIMNEGYLY